MDTETRDMLKEIQETQIMILSKLFDMEKRVDGTTRSSPADYTQEVHRWIKSLREFVAANGRQI